MMNRIVLMLFLSLAFSVNIFAQAENFGKGKINQAETLLELNEKKVAALEAMEEFYARISNEVSLLNLQIKEINNGFNNRFGAAGAQCSDGSTLLCSGEVCVAEDDVGCACASGGVINDIQPCDP